VEEEVGRTSINFGLGTKEKASHVTCSPRVLSTSYEGFSLYLLLKYTIVIKTQWCPSRITRFKTESFRRAPHFEFIGEPQLF
jgi:hypothetical protein